MRTYENQCFLLYGFVYQCVISLLLDGNRILVQQRPRIGICDDKM